MDHPTNLEIFIFVYIELHVYIKTKRQQIGHTILNVYELKTVSLAWRIKLHFRHGQCLPTVFYVELLV